MANTFLVRRSPQSLRDLAISIAFVQAVGCAPDPDSSTVDMDGSESLSVEPTWNYAIMTQVFDPALTDAMSYVLFSESLDTGEELSLDRSIEVAGRSWLYAPDTSGTFYVAAGEEFALIKYEIDSFGSVKEVDRVSFASTGGTAFNGSQLIFPDAQHAWMVDLSSGQILEILLSSPMQLGRSVDATSLQDPDIQRFPTTYVTVLPQRRRGDVFIGVTYGFSYEGDSFSEVSKIVLFDTNTGELQSVPAPCGGLSYSMVATDGSIYFLTDPLLAAVHAIDASRAPAPCIARLPPDSFVPDPDPIALTELTGGRPVGGVVPGNGDIAYVRVLNEDLAPITPYATGLGLYGEAAWETWQLDLATLAPAQPLGGAPLAGGITFFEVDGDVYENQSDDGFGATTLFKTTGPAAFEAALRMPGVPFAVQRIR